MNTNDEIKATETSTTEEDKKESKASIFFQKASDIGKKAAEGMQKSVIAMSEKSKSDSYLRRLKKYNPLFPDTYNDNNFNIPHMIRIVDDVVRSGIDVCEGAIGWLSTEKDLQVLHLYDEAVEFSKLQFIPNVECNAIYYADNFDRHRFIKVESIFGRAHDERLAELKHIAHSLGAKSCSIEITESGSELKSQKSTFNIQGKKGPLSDSTESAQKEASINKSEYRRGRIIAEFEGSDSPKKPQLKWFAHDDNIKRLIEMRCSNRNSIKSETLELEGSTSATMSQRTASAIDFAISKIGSKSSLNLEKHAQREHHSKLIFIVEF